MKFNSKQNLLRSYSISLENRKMLLRTDFLSNPLYRPETTGTMERQNEGGWKPLKYCAIGECRRLNR